MSAYYNNPVGISERNVCVRCASCARFMFSPSAITYVYAHGKDECPVFNGRAPWKSLVLVCGEQCFTKATTRLLLAGWSERGSIVVEQEDFECYPYTYQVWASGESIVTLARYNWTREKHNAVLIEWVNRTVAEEQERIKARLSKEWPIPR